MMLQRNPAVLFQPVAEGAILLHTRQEVYFGLNSVGCQVWQLVPDSGTDVTTLVEELARLYPDVSRSDLYTDVTELVESLTSAGLLLSPVQA